jgi:hypothetical protein
MTIHLQLGDLELERFTTCFFGETIIKNAYIIRLKKCLKNSLKLFLEET